MLINDRNVNNNVGVYKNMNTNDVKSFNNSTGVKKKETLNNNINSLKIIKSSQNNVALKKSVQDADLNNNGINIVGIDDNDQSEFIYKAKRPNERTIAIIGDSLVKDVDPFDLRKKLKNKNSKVYRHNFNGATIKAMNYHAIPVMEFEPDLAILHVGTNSLRSMDTEQKIADDILNLANNIKKDTNEIIISSIIPRRTIVLKRITLMMRLKMTLLTTTLTARKTL